MKRSEIIRNNTEIDSEVNSEVYLPLTNAAKIAETTPGYLKILIHRGKLKGVKQGRNWFTTREWLNEYSKPTNKLPLPVVSTSLEIISEEKSQPFSFLKLSLVSGLIALFLIFSLAATFNIAPSRYQASLFTDWMFSLFMVSLVEPFSKPNRFRN